MLVRQTLSFCPVCYKRIPAEIHIEDAVIMRKNCSEHGKFESMVERDPMFWSKCMTAGTTNIYNGYFLDVTERCNLACEYCFYGVDNSSKDPSIEFLTNEALMHSNIGPIILTGGEPSLREDLPEIIKTINAIAPGIELLTNGTGLSPSMLEEILPQLTNPNGVIRINLSMHTEAEGADQECLEYFRENKLKLESVLCVIDDVEQIVDILQMCDENSDVIESVRIKAATRLWNEQGPSKKIFVSDMLKFCGENFNATNIWWRNNKVSFFNAMVEGVFAMFVSWYDVKNVDLFDIACPPYYKARTGSIENIVTACIINEGLKAGYMNGRKVNHAT